jgi:cation transporter-like permease
MSVLNLRHPDFKSVKVTAPAGGYAAGDLVAVGAFVGQIVEAALEGVEAVLIYACQKIELPKAVGVVSVGDRLYFDPDNECLTTVLTAPGYVAVCTKAAGNLDTAVECDLFGTTRLDLTAIGS